MSATYPVSLTPREIVRLLNEHRKLWLTTTIAGAVLALGYSFVAPRYWEASQALVVRQETAGSFGAAPGKFTDLFEMRTLQETILEMAKSRKVVVATLVAADRRLSGREGAEPTAKDVEEFRRHLKMLPPDGGEFGKTEVFYFYVKDPSRARAMELVSELCLQLDAGLKKLRADRAGSLIVELDEQVRLAAAVHADDTARLVEFETQVGADLGELRMLHSASSGQSDLRQESVLLEADVRRYEQQVSDSEQLLALLQAAVNDPLQIVATPNSLLTSQPALRRLKDGLVDAQLATARIGGIRTAEHPRVKAAVESEAEIRRDLHRELSGALKGVEVDLRLGRDRLAASKQRLTDLQARLTKLAELRGEYSNRVAAVENSRVTLDKARQNLSVAQAAQAAARTGSLVTRIDLPETGPYPAGPGRKVMAGAGAVSGLMLGLGLVFLSVGPRPENHREIVGRAAATGSPGNEAGERDGESSAQPKVEEWWESLPPSTPTSGVPAVESADEEDPVESRVAPTLTDAAAWRRDSSPASAAMLFGPPCSVPAIDEFSGMTLQQAMRTVGAGAKR